MLSCSKATTVNSVCPPSGENKNRFEVQNKQGVTACVSCGGGEQEGRRDGGRDEK